MPQLSVSTYFSQVFWFLVFFSLLFFVITYFFLPKLDSIINIRSRKLLNSFYGSIYLLRSAEDFTSKRSTAISKAKAKAKKIIEDALLQVEKMKVCVSRILEEEDRKTNKLIENQVVEFKHKFNGELKTMATAIAIIYYHKLTNLKIEEKLIAKFISKEF